MGAWKDWEIGMIEDGNTPEQIKAAEARIKGTLADPLVSPMPTEFHAYTGESLDAREHEWRIRTIHLVKQAFPGAEVVDDDTEREAA